MDKSTLFLIIAFEAVIIVWLASKLKHYKKFEHLLSDSNSRTTENNASSASGNRSAQSTTGQTSSVSASSALPSVLDDDLLNAPGVESDVNIEEAKRVQLVMARCRYAEFYLEQLDDDYERGQFHHIVDSCAATARAIDDQFFKASALHPLVLLLDRAGWDEYRDKLISEVQDDIVRQRIVAELDAQSA